LAYRATQWNYGKLRNQIFAPEPRMLMKPTERVLAVREHSDGYWYIGAGRSIAEGPYRYPQQLLAVASDLLAFEPHWRIEVFDVAGSRIISYSSTQIDSADLNASGGSRQWTALTQRASH
jgi:hypothetical protein